MDVRATPDGVTVSMRVRPRSRPGFAERDGVLLVSVEAPSVEGRATEQARRALASALQVAPSAVRLRSGERSRSKVFHVTGVDIATAVRRLTEVANAGGPDPT